MKQNKTKTLAIASITTLAVTGALALAWFVTQTDSAAIDVDAGTIIMEADGIGVAGDYANILPGETIYADAGLGLTNGGTRALIAEINFDNDYITATLAKKLTDFTNDEVVAFESCKDDYTIAADGTISMKPERVAEVIKVAMDMPENELENNWIRFDDKYYSRLEVGTGKTAFNGLFVEALAELGGKVNNAGGAQGETSNRQFEQGASFVVKYSARGVQASRKAIIDEYGQAPADLIDGLTKWYDFD